VYDDDHYGVVTGSVRWRPLWCSHSQCTMTITMV